VTDSDAAAQWLVFLSLASSTAADLLLAAAMGAALWAKHTGFSR
jgi:hypothetical protein